MFKQETNNIKNAEELTGTEKELCCQNKEEDTCEAELIIVKEKLAFKDEEKEKRASELIIANEELAYQNEEKEKRASELIIANEELVFQNEEKEKRASELIIANEELVFQNEEKEKRAAELITANTALKKAKKKLVSSAKQLRLALGNMLEGVQIHDFNWRYIYANDALVKYSKYSREELLGNTLMEKYPGIEQTHLFKVLQRCMTDRVAEHLETEFFFPDGSKTDFELSVQPTPEGIFILSIDITERKKGIEYQRQLAEQQIKQHKLITETIIQTQEKERDQLGRELHDNINQILATVKMYLGMAKANENVSVDLVGQSFAYVTEAMEEIRKLSHSLVAPSLGVIGLKETLQGLVEDANLLNGLQVQLFFDEKYYEKNIDKDKELMLYRIVQEQMNNIMKHARAKNAVITLKTGNDNLLLSVADDGVGFDATQMKKGIGLKNISSRVEFYSGKMNIISAPGKGCIIEAFIPANS